MSDVMKGPLPSSNAVNVSASDIITYALLNTAILKVRVREHLKHRLPLWWLAGPRWLSYISSSCAVHVFCRSLCAYVDAGGCPTPSITYLTDTHLISHRLTRSNPSSFGVFRPLSIPPRSRSLCLSITAERPSTRLPSSSILAAPLFPLLSLRGHLLPPPPPTTLSPYPHGTTTSRSRSP
jgi:hypothetical protein